MITIIFAHLAIFAFGLGVGCFCGIAIGRKRADRIARRALEELRQAQARMRELIDELKDSPELWRFCGLDEE